MQILTDRRDVVDDVSMGQHDALRATGGAGGVDDGCEIRVGGIMAGS